MATPRSTLARALIIVLVAVVIVAALGAWLYTTTPLGERAQNVQRRLAARFLPHEAPAVAFVPTPVISAAEKEAALSLLATATVAPTAPPPTATTSPAVSQAAVSQPAAPAASPTAPRPPATPTLAVALAPIVAKMDLGAMRHEYQGWNNCGPTTIAMDLNFFGKPTTQKDAAAALKPDPNDKNVGPDELAEYAHSLGMGGAYRVNGNLGMLKALLSNGIPVIVEHWFIPEPNDEMGHYKLLKGYDDEAQVFIANDSYNGPNIRIGYADFDRLWKVFNRTYVVVYPMDKEAVVKAIVGQDWDEKAMWQRSLAGAQTGVAQDQNDKFAWFNLGSSLEALGKHQEAARAYDQARRLDLPWRMLWYQFGPFDAYMAVGRYQDVLSLADANLKTASNLEESHFYRGKALQAMGQTGEARKAFEQAVKLNTNYQRAKDALSQLTASQ
ncbi:MAG: tetratricopeptide repeat protein [Anaerolineae bacterium]